MSGVVPINRKARRAQQARRRKLRSSVQKTVAPPLIAACMSLFSLPAHVFAQSVVGLPEPEARVKYMTYSDHQSDGSDRMRINAPMAMVRAKPADDLLLEGIFTYDGISGASPYYLDSLSGASGLGIHDTRYEGQVRVAKQFEYDIVGTTFFLSDEDDYKSIAGSFDYTHGIQGTDTQVFASASYADDQVSSSQNQELQERRDNTSAAIGFSQLLDEVSLFSSSIGFSFSRGYLTDPYKTLDSRPSSRREFTWMNRYIRFIESTEGSIHCDFRVFSDDWGINSQTLDLSYYQPIGESWLLKPSIRYYSQHKATFYQDTFPPQDIDFQDYSADQRLSTFGSLTFGFRLERALTENLSFDASVNYMEQRSAWSLVNDNGAPLESLYALFYGIGLYQKF